MSIQSFGFQVGDLEDESPGRGHIVSTIAAPKCVHTTDE